MAAASSISEAIFQAASGTWDWTTVDCCRYAAEVLRLIHGIEVRFPGEYAGQAEAEALLARCGGMRGAIRAALGEPSGRYVDGDLVAVRAPGGDCAGIFWAGHAWCRTESGLLKLPAHRIIEGWHFA